MPNKSIFELFKTDKASETEGTWLDYGDFGRFRVARAGGANTAYNRERERLLKPYRHALQNGTFTEKQGLEVAAKAISKHLVQDWELIDADGLSIPFSAAKCEELLLQLPDLTDAILTFALSLSNYQPEVRAADAKN